ncbi:MAG: transposase [Euryarchaeota archaeon]|nr:transposase [Euryarchaeota archaeon]
MKHKNLICELCVPEDEKALKIFRCIRWSDGVYCPECKSFETYKRGYLNNTQIKRYSCKSCGNNFTGTILPAKNSQLVKCST